MRADRASETALLVAEELRFDERGRQRPAVDRDERPGAARARFMDRARDQLLAAAAFAAHEHGGLGGCDARDELKHGVDRRRAPDQMDPAPIVPVIDRSGYCKICRL